MKKAKVVVFPNQKGGVGKTSVTLSVAVEKASAGFKTCIIDCDDQANSSAWILGNVEIEFELADVLLKKCEYKDALKKTSIDNLYVLPSVAINGSLKLYSKTTANESPFIMRHLIKNLTSEDFDYIFLDVPPNFMSVVESCMLAADEAIIVLKLDEFSSDGLVTLFKNISSMQERFDTDQPVMNKIILNQRDSRMSVQNKKIKDIKEAIPENFKIYIIPTDQAFPKSQVMKTPVQYISNIKKETLTVLKNIAESI